MLNLIIEKIEKQLAETEESQAAIEQEMTDPKYISDPGALMDLQKELDTLESQQEELLTEWEEANLALENNK